MSGRSMAEGRRIGWEAGFAVVIGIGFLAVATVSAAGDVPGLVSAGPVLALVLVVTGLLVLGSGVYFLAMVRTNRSVPLGGSRARTDRDSLGAQPSEEEIEASGAFVNPVDLDREPLELIPAPAERPRTVVPSPAAIAAEAVQRSVRAAVEYREAVQPVTGSIAFSAVIGSPATPTPVQGGPAPSAPIESTPPLTVPSGAPFPGVPLLPRPDEPPLSPPPATSPRIGLSPARSGGFAGPPIAQVPSAPTPRVALSPDLRRCVSCESSLAGDSSVPLCWGCGRPLCSSCYWRTRTGSGMHRCPECTVRAARSPSVTPAVASAPSPVPARVPASGPSPSPTSGYSRR